MLLLLLAVEVILLMKVSTLLRFLLLDFFPSFDDFKLKTVLTVGVNVILGSDDGAALGSKDVEGSEEGEHDGRVDGWVEIDGDVVGPVVGRSEGFTLSEGCKDGSLLGICDTDGKAEGTIEVVGTGEGLFDGT